MKKLVIAFALTVFLFGSVAFAQDVVLFPDGITISQIDKKALEYDLLDIEQWIRDAIKGKIANCKGRMIQQWQPKILADPAITQMPASEEGLIDFIISRPNYENRKQRKVKENK